MLDEVPDCWRVWGVECREARDGMGWGKGKGLGVRGGDGEMRKRRGRER